MHGNIRVPGAGSSGERECQAALNPGAGGAGEGDLQVPVDRFQRQCLSALQVHSASVADLGTRDGATEMPLQACDAAGQFREGYRRTEFKALLETALMQ